MKINIPHIHKIEGEAGFWAEITKQGKVEHLKIETLEGLRQIEGILVGRRFSDVPLVVSRICGICPIVHILNACCAVEKALEIEVSPLTVLLRKLILSSQIIQSHTLHMFFMTLADFFDIERDLDLMKKFPREAKAALKIRDFSLEIINVIGGRRVHPLTPQVGGFLKLPEKKDIENLLKSIPTVLEESLILAETFKNLSYPFFKRGTKFLSVVSEGKYPFYREDLVKIGNDKISVGNFYSNEIEEELKGQPAKKTKYQGRSYMLGAIARIKNNSSFLSPDAKKVFEDFKKKDNLSDEEFFQNTFYNLFSQTIEVVNFIDITEKLLKEILKLDLKEKMPEIKISKGSGLSAMEAPRGTLFTYIELDKEGRVLNCNIITPTAQFLNNLEEDLKVFLPSILKLSGKDRIKKLRSLIRVYDPCISCATH